MKWCRNEIIRFKKLMTLKTKNEYVVFGFLVIMHK